MFSNNRSIEITFNYFYLVLLLLISWWIVTLIQVLVSFKLFVQSIFCLFLTCMYHIYWISVHWSWKLSSGVIANRQWSVSKPYIRSCFPRKLAEGGGKGLSFFIAPVTINTFIGFKKVPRVIEMWNCIYNCWPKGHKVPLG